MGHKVENSVEDLLRSIESGDLDRAEHILERVSSINEMATTTVLGEPFMWTALHASCYFGYTDLVKNIIDAGASLESVDTLYQSGPLGWAAYGGHLQTCKLLVKYGADITAKNVHGQTPYGLVRKPTSDWDFLTGKKVNIDQVTPMEEIKISLRRSRPSSEVQLTDGHHSPKLKIKLRATTPDPEVQEDNLRLDEDVPIAIPEPILTPSTNKSVNSIGLVSNANIIRSILSTDIHSYSLTTDASVRTINFRILLAPKVINGNNILVTHNMKKLNSLGIEKVDISGGKIQDYNAVLQSGVNAFEIKLIGHVCNENYSIFINRLD